MSSGRTRNHNGPATVGTFRPHDQAGPAAAVALRSPSPSSSNDQNTRSDQRQDGREDRDNDRENPFAPPPEDAPDQPWRPRTPPERGGRGQGVDQDGDQQGSGPGSGRQGAPWSSRQPGRQDGGGFGGNGGGLGGGGRRGPRFDVTDPVQRRARYALLAGLWGFFFTLFGLPQIALLLGALALYWGISSLRGNPRAQNGRTGGGNAGTSGNASGRQGETRGTSAGPFGPSRAAGPGGHYGDRPARPPQFGTAVSGLVAGGVALAMVLALFVLQLVYRDYFECVSDALTSKARSSCSQHIPDWVEPLVGAAKG